MSLKVVFGSVLFLVLCLILFNFSHTFKAIHKSSQASISNNANASLIAWGDNSNGQLGYDFAPSQDPLAIKISNIKSVSAGQNHSLALTKEGQVYVWGNNKFGQLGYTTKHYYEPTPIILPGVEHIKNISINSNHSLLLKDDGTVLSFGSNFTGQIGDGTNISRITPTVVQGIDQVREISAGYKFSLAIRDDNTVWAWGTSCDPQNQDEAKKLLQDFAGNLASLEGGYYDSGSTTTSTANQSEDCLNEDIIGIKSKTPKQIIGLGDVKDVSGGYGHVLALKNDGTVWTFGCNHYEQLGQLPDLHSLANASPKQVSLLPPISMISAGFRHSLVLTKDGHVWAWGHNQYGELGQGKTGDPNPVPKEIKGLSDVVFIAAGFDYSLVVKKDGSVWGWGTNNFKQLGKDSASIITTPIQLQKLNSIEFVSAGGAHVLALSK